MPRVTVIAGGVGAATLGIVDPCGTFARDIVAIPGNIRLGGRSLIKGPGADHAVRKAAVVFRIVRIGFRADLGSVFGAPAIGIGIVRVGTMD